MADPGEVCSGCLIPFLTISAFELETYGWTPPPFYPVLESPYKDDWIEPCERTV